MTNRWIANPRTPKPCPIAFEGLRQEAQELWGDSLITREALVEWARAGCPNAAGTLSNPETKQPHLAGHAQTDPEMFVEQLIKTGIFVRPK